MRPMWYRKHVRDSAEARADGFDVEMKHKCRKRCGRNRNQEHGQARRIASQHDDDRKRAERNRKGRGIERARAGKISLPFAEHVARRMREPQAKEIADLACEDDDRDTRRETRDHGIGHIFDEGADARKPGRDQHHARHDGGDDQSVVTEFLDDVENDDDERARRTADLKAAAAERGNDKARDHGGEESALGCGATRNRQRHR